MPGFMPCICIGLGRIDMVELLSPHNAYVGVNLVMLLVLVLLSAVFFICFSGFVKYSIVLNIIKKRGGYSANTTCYRG